MLQAEVTAQSRGGQRDDDVGSIRLRREVDVSPGLSQVSRGLQIETSSPSRPREGYVCVGQGR